MGSKFLCNIDLKEVCAAWYDFWDEHLCNHALSIPSVPPQICGMVMHAFRCFVERDDPNTLDPDELADLIDSWLYPVGGLLHLAKEDEQQEVSQRAHLAHNEGRIYSAIYEHVPPNDYTVPALLIFQLDRLCGAYQQGRLDAALHLFADIVEMERDLSGYATSSRLRKYHARNRESIARKGAMHRHAQTNQQKSALLAEWDATASEYKSRADFTRIVSQREGLKYRTLYEWIGAHDRAKA